jgi:DNA-binding winged helix-turn-helix (wHTH) protein
MATPLREKRFYEFGAFRLDASIPVLVRNGDIVPLTPKSLDTLLVLLQNAGNVVEKETLIRTVWPSVFVEESNLAQQIYALRRVLGDGDVAAVRIETVPKRGYRLTGKVIEVREEAAIFDPITSDSCSQNDIDVTAGTPVSPATPLDSRRAIVRPRDLLLAVAMAAVLVATAFSLRLIRSSTGGIVFGKQRQLTANTEQDPVLRSAISPDGKYLAYSDRAGIHVLVADTGESRLLQSPGNLCFR